MAFKLSNFDVHDGIVFGSVQGIELKTAILIPKKLEKGKKAPVLVHWHGGGFMTGGRLFAPWFAIWFLQLAEATGSIVVSPDYRLLPENTSDEMLDDIVSFWSWLPKHLPAEVSRITSGTLDVDVTDIATGGESAGGLLSVNSPMLCPDANIKAVICQYGPLDYNNIPWFTEASNRAVMGVTPTRDPNAIVDDYLDKHVRVDKVIPRTESRVDLFWPVCRAYLHSGRFADTLGTSKRMRSMELLDTAKTLPPVWFIQGLQDTVVDPNNTWNFVEKVRKLLPETPMHVQVIPGEHGFDSEIEIQEDWVQEGLEFLSKYWPSRS